MNDNIKPKSEQIDKARTTLIEEFARLSVHRLVKKYSRESIVAAAKELGVVTTGMSSSALVSAVKTLLKSADRQHDPAFQRHINSASAPLIDPTVGQFGVRCVYCGEVVMEIQAGFSPIRPVNVLGKPIPVHLWPFQFKGPETMDPTDLASRQRENPKCPFCDRDIAVEGITERGATTILQRALIQLAPPEPERDEVETQAIAR